MTAAAVFNGLFKWVVALLLVIALMAVVAHCAVPGDVGPGEADMGRGIRSTGGGCRGALVRFHR